MLLSPGCSHLIKSNLNTTSFLITELRNNAFQEAFLEILGVRSDTIKIRRFCKLDFAHSVFVGESLHALLVPATLAALTVS